ncbi:hypothetical protein LBMAG56_16230 [Verrucomicrobiota bacterium]|nr:hypothetical protein LBMAG56_16230 [Verrucomicrobiota bacterium]
MRAVHVRRNGAEWATQAWGFARDDVRRTLAPQRRDIIALEHTAEGFDLHLCDSPNGGADYEVTIAITRLK